ncbi:NAD-binding protein [Mycena crocata]|nr:NAD-binding protein [Mycena crocata]
MSSKGIALVTGAAQGIGRAIALRLGEDGFDVAVNDISVNSEKLQALVEEIKEKGRRSSKYVADVSQEDQVKQMIKLVVKHHAALDVMVANAGVVGRPELSFVEVSLEEWDRVMNVNAQGTFLCYKYAAVEIIKQGGGGRIIGASSFAGKQGIGSQPVYSASKFAVRGLTQSAALEFGAHNITVNAYAPGAVNTSMAVASEGPEKAAAGLNYVRNKLKEDNIYRSLPTQFEELSLLELIGAPEDIADLVSFLASKRSQFITEPFFFWQGQIISINGGIYFD